jgi:hypothetical protein
MVAYFGDEIVESRTWSSGVEIVARVNWSQIARIRRALGVVGEQFSLREFVPVPRVERRNQRPARPWLRARPRAA